jgi:SAM-dependent methyltransferase
MHEKYDTVGVNYSDLRRPDARIARLIEQALGSAKTVLNVGAGTGSYEPADREVTAIEPSMEMIRQRDASAAPVIQGYAEDLPFDDNSFDASMAILTVHHWSDKEKGLKEMRRVTRGQVVLLTFDPSGPGFWLADYIPELVTLDDRQMPAITDYAKWLGPVMITTVPIPHDCTDGFLCANWRRPAAYLDPKVRSAVSSFHAISGISSALEKLENDLESGAWARQYSDLLTLDECDFGYRLVTTK